MDDIDFSLHSNELGAFLKYDFFPNFYDLICFTFKKFTIVHGTHDEYVDIYFDFNVLYF